MPVARDAAMGGAATRRRSTGALSSCGVHPAASAQWLGAIASGADLSAAVPSRMGHAGSVWTRPQTPDWSTGHDGCAAHLGADSRPACASALPGTCGCAR